MQDVALFIAHYKLETNPFAAQRARPFFTSESMRYVELKLEHLLEGRLQSLYLSGQAGVGKSTLVGHHLDGRRDIHLSWVKPDMQEPQQLLQKLLVDIGPGEIKGSINELRNVLEVFLKHQAAHGRRSVIVVDALERLALPVIRELESLGRLRLRRRPVVHCVLITRNEDLIASLMAHEESGTLCPSVHQRLVGFTPEETGAYIRACLHGAGCSWVEELVPEEAIVDIQGFTRGVVGDINALCREALETVAAQSSEFRQPRVTRAVLKEAGARLHLRYEPTPWARREGEAELSPEAIQVADPAEGEAPGQAARLIVTSGANLIAEVPLRRRRMVLGRDESCDIRLDSSYVSRYQNLFMETPDGWMLFDLNSTNGCFVNGRRVSEHRLRDGDLIAVGQHQLRFATAGARPAEPPETRSPAEDTLVSPKPIVGKTG
ncbi:MAG TPA: FHA domain-containing protein [Gammaproteobacteria bacterium]